jgi:hypothetical protein
LNPHFYPTDAGPGVLDPNLNVRFRMREPLLIVAFLSWSGFPI